MLMGALLQTGRATGLHACCIAEEAAALCIAIDSILEVYMVIKRSVFGYRCPQMCAELGCTGRRKQVLPLQFRNTTSQMRVPTCVESW